jgi:hypothetical protein
VSYSNAVEQGHSEWINLKRTSLPKELWTRGASSTLLSATNGFYPRKQFEALFNGLKDYVDAVKDDSQECGGSSKWHPRVFADGKKACPW